MPDLSPSNYQPAPSPYWVNRSLWVGEHSTGSPAASSLTLEGGAGWTRGFPGGTVGKTPLASAGATGELGSDLWVGKIPWRRKWQPTPVFVLEKSLGQRSLAGYSPWGSKESDMTEHASYSKSSRLGLG